MEAVDDFRGPRRPDNILDLLQDAMEDPDYDPEDKDYKGLWRWSDGRVATPGEVRKWDPDYLVENMADEMAAEIDREILQTLLAAQQPAPIIIDDVVIPDPPLHILATIMATPVDRYFKDAARRIWGQGLA